MTHAALQDRKTHVSVLTELRNDVNPEGADPYGHMVAEALDAAIAALSAMEGEAVVWVDPADVREQRHGLMGTADATQQQGTRYTMALYTAPPPQQADNPLDRVVRIGDLPAPITNPEAWPPNYADGFNDAVRMQVGPATHPTPSPGPQGGGEDKSCEWPDCGFDGNATRCNPDYCCNKKRAPVPAGYVCPEQFALMKRDGGGINFGPYSERYMRTMPLYEHPPLATPPQPEAASKPRIVGVDYGTDDQTSFAINCPCGRLHDITAAIAAPPQPEAQVTDAMVNKSLHIWFTENQTGSLFERMHAVLTAALTTSGRDGDG